MVINLAGIQSLEIPPSIFDEYFMKRGKHAKYPEGADTYVDILWDKDNKYQSKREPALAVKLDNCTLGYIPVLSTIEGYINTISRQMGQAMVAMDADEHNRLRKKYDWHNDRYEATSLIRGQIETDLFINHLPVRGKLHNVKIAEDTEKVLSVSVGIDMD